MTIRFIVETHGRASLHATCTLHTTLLNHESRAFKS